MKEALHCACVEPQLERRLRSPAPPGTPVVPGSTPVPAFGDFTTARVATLGLNPSRAEFLSRSGELLAGAEARFVTLPALRLASLQDASTDALTRVMEGTRRYFQNRPYLGWFGRLDSLLRISGATYFDGSACHLDLAHWATDPVWAKLSPGARGALIEDGLSFLMWQLTTFSIAHVFLNGRGVCLAVEKRLGVKLKELETLPGPLGKPAKLYFGQLADGPIFIGWSVNLQSSFGVTKDFSARLAQRLQAHMRSTFSSETDR